MSNVFSIALTDLDKDNIIDNPYVDGDIYFTYKLKKLIEEYKNKLHELKMMFVFLNEKIPELNISIDYNKFYLAGGAVRDTWNSYSPKDYDFFCSDKELIDIIRKIFKHESVEAILKTYKYKIEIEHTAFKNINLSFYDKKKLLYIIQLCIIEPKEPLDMINSFDFTINQGFINHSELVISKDIILGSKYLYPLDNIRYPINALYRIPKFLEKGYKVMIGTYFNIVNQCNTRKETEPLASLAIEMSGTSAHKTK